MADINLKTQGNSLESLIVGWEGKDLVIENLSNNNIDFDLTFYTSYLPWVEEFKPKPDIKSLQAISDKYHFPFKKNYSGSVTQGQRIRLSPDNWNNLPNSNIDIIRTDAIGDIDKPISHKDNGGQGCKAALGDRNLKSEWLLLLLMLLLIKRRVNA